MASLASNTSTGPEKATNDPADPLRQVVHVALAVYLMPVIAIVCVIGGVSILVERTTRIASRFASEGHRGAPPPLHVPLARRGRTAWKASGFPDRRRTRAHR